MIRPAQAALSDTQIIRAVVDAFLPLAAIPRPSKHEAAVSAYLVQWAQARGLAVARDAVHNVRIDLSASPDAAHAPLVILQSHMDMVCVGTPGSGYDPRTTPIRVRDDGHTLTAEGTSLGADDGVGIAISLYLLENPPQTHGPVRVLITADEEDGMTGATQLDLSWLRDAAYCVNLDSEDYGVLCNSSAGSRVMSLTRPLTWTPARGAGLALTVEGLHGGHSGVDIHKGYANAVRVLALALDALRTQGGAVAIAEMTGGTFSNAIPDHATAPLAVEAAQASEATRVLTEVLTQAQVAWAGIEPHMTARVSPCPLPQQVLSSCDSDALLDVLLLAPCGVRSMSPFVAGLVESSANLGPVTVTAEEVRVCVHARSSAERQMCELTAGLRATARVAGFTLTVDSDMPGWPLYPESRLVPLMCDIFAAQTGEVMRTEAIHAGLECGWFAAKAPGLDIVSIGPDVRDVHSTRETLHLASLPGCVRLLWGLLERVSQAA